ncbi:hypothetical protein AHF37_07414 [Paragonimus kellicotti]|nr:hypothetical protein AHF37_07414 [Paragonimus kellicotti]
MAASIFKLAHPDLVKQSIIDLGEPLPTRSADRSSADDAQLFPSDQQLSTINLSEYRHLLHGWLDSVVTHTLWSLVDHSELTLPLVRQLTAHIGLATRLSCAVYYYYHCLSKAAATAAVGNESFSVFVDHYLLALRDESAHSAADFLADDRVNNSHLIAFIQSQAASTDSFTRLPRLKEQLSQLDLTSPLSPLQELLLVAEFYHWLVPSYSNRTALLPLRTTAPPDCSVQVENHSKISPTSSRCSSSIQNGVLQNIVKRSAVVARSARPAHPNSRPLALLNTSAVEQLVTSTTPSDLMNPALDQVDPHDPDNVSTVINSHEKEPVDRTDVNDDLLKNLVQAASRIENLSNEDTKDVGRTGYYVARQHPESTDFMECSPASPRTHNTLERNNLYATFSKRPSPAVSDKLPVIGSPKRIRSSKSSSKPSSTTVSPPCSKPTVPCLRSEFENRRRSRSVLSAEQSATTKSSMGTKE